ncbi:MAG TPA: transposase, partial [Candidatus Binataceae bacterium]|nr:transposase [Candidatus Binataceae bacterium]
SRRERKRIEMRFAHLKRILRLGRLRLRGPRGAQDEFTLAAIAQNLRQMAKANRSNPGHLGRRHRI